MAKITRNHQLLGRVHSDEIGSLWECSVNLQPGYQIGLSMIVEENWKVVDPDVIFAAAVEYLEFASRFEKKCRNRIAADLLPLYNRSWASESEYGQLPRKAFSELVTPKSITLYHDGSATWLYDCGSMFGGHAITICIGANHSFVGKAGLFG